MNIMPECIFLCPDETLRCQPTFFDYVLHHF